MLHENLAELIANPVLNPADTAVGDSLHTTDQRDAMVWDLPLRLFHWSMVCSVLIAGVTGFLAPEWWLDEHVLAGYCLTALLLFRLWWGFIGTRYSRFSSFPLQPAGLRRYLSALPSGRLPDGRGHNPAGAWMIVLLMVLLMALIISGVLTLGGQEKLGPLASVVKFETGVIAADVHRVVAFGLMGAVTGHLLGVLADCLLFRQAVLTAMITGSKKAVPGALVGEPAVVLRGGLVFASVSLLLWIGITLSSESIEPPDAAPEWYQAECGDCHTSYHPSLRSGEAWSAIIAGLADHYGEDASLSESVSQTIETYLTTEDATRYDTEAAHRIGRIETPSLRMTDVPFWQERHRDIDPAVFDHQRVGSKVNCEGCHLDAIAGRFADAEIQLPGGERK